MKKPSIEIGIPAYNEEANIQALLKSIASQVTKNCEIEHIYLVSDGSNDQTVKKAEELGINKLKIIDSRDRMGKSQRMGQLFSMAKTDYIVLLDADVILGNEHAIDAIVSPMLSSDISLTSGRPAKVKTGTFGDRVMDVSLFLQDYTKEKYHHGINVYACHGRIVGLRRDLFSKLHLPYSTIGNDAYLYFFNEKNAKGFKYCPDAVVLFKMPQTFKDFVKQKGRFADSRVEQASIFGKHVFQEYEIPRTITTKALLFALLKHHIYTLTYVLWRIWPAEKTISKSGKWEVSDSTKNLNQ